MTAAPILFVDLDGTVRHGKAELGRFVNTPDDVVVFPEAIRRMREWRESGGVVIGVTNQGGVGLGYMTEDEHQAVVKATVARADWQINHVVACEHRPDEGCWCRKPMPGLIFHGAMRGDFDMRPGDCLMVGDMDTDRECAERAGVPFQWADAWRAGEAA